MQMTKEAVRKLQKGDFIPNGARLTEKDLQELKFRKTHRTEIQRCAMAIGNDSQSGLLYCGDVADYVAKTKTGILCLCEKHYKLVSSR